MEAEKLDLQLGGGDADDCVTDSKKKDHRNGDENKQDALNGFDDDHGNQDDDDDDSDMPELIDSKPKAASNNADASPVKNIGTNSEEIGRTEDTNKTTSAVNTSEVAGSTEEPEWMDVLGNGALKKKVLKEGQGAATRPQRGELVTMRSKGSLEDGSEVDCHESINFVLGEGDVVSGRYYLFCSEFDMWICGQVLLVRDCRLRLNLKKSLIWGRGYHPPPNVPIL